MNVLVVTRTIVSGLDHTGAVNGILLVDQQTKTGTLFIHVVTVYQVLFLITHYLLPHCQAFPVQTQKLG